VRTIHVAEAGFAAAAATLRRAVTDFDAERERVVRDIVAEVRARGDAALLDLGRRFDCPSLGSLEVTEAEWDAACAAVEVPDREAIAQAAARIQAFHERQRRSSWIEAEDGLITGQMLRPLERVGLYVPGGTAVYPSSVLMAAIPARAAGVGQVVMCTPCGRQGQVHPLVLHAARVAGVSRVFKVGGAQAVAAMAFGTATVPPVDKIAGPGNAYVNLAKRQLWGLVDMDMLAGPSEVCVVADEGANPAFVAADLLTQAEHDPDSAAFLITPSAALAAAASAELERQMAGLPRRDILRRALEGQGAVVVAESLEQAVELANVCAPEHLALMVRDPWPLLASVRNAGAILLGDHTPQTLGDYLAGPSHTLPTSGTARFSSPLNVDTFLKKTSVIACTPERLARAAPVLRRLARVEGLEAHAAAVDARLEGGHG